MISLEQKDEPDDGVSPALPVNGVGLCGVRT